MLRINRRLDLQGSIQTKRKRKTYQRKKLKCKKIFRCRIQKEWMDLKEMNIFLQEKLKAERHPF